MPIDLSDIPDEGDGRLPPTGEDFSLEADSTTKRLFRQHPEGGGPYGGRNNALAAFVGYLLYHRFDRRAAHQIAFWFNRQYCSPPEADEIVRSLVERGYVDWQPGPEQGALADVPASKILSVAELLEIAMSDEQKLAWIAKDLIQRDGLTIISGPSGNGKTWLAADFCRHLTRSEDEEFPPWLGRWALPRMRCLYLDGENGEATMAERVYRLGFLAGNKNFYSWSDPQIKLNEAKDRQRLAKVAKDMGIELLVWDSLTAFHSSNEDKSYEMRRVGEWLREFVLAGMAVVVLHHDRKSNGYGDNPDQDKTRGSGDIVAFSQTVLGLEQKSGVFYLSQRKVRNAERSSEVIPFKLSEDELGGLYIDTDAGRAEDDDRRERGAEERAKIKRERVREAIDILEKKGLETTNKGIAEIARMSLRDVGIARREIQEGVV